MRRLSPPAAVVLSAAFLVAAAAVGIAFGSTTLDPTSALALSLRAPRVALGAVAGGGLAVVGVAFQAVLRNPLAEPYLLGVSGGAALGASIAIAAGADADVMGLGAVPAAATLGGIAATVVVFSLARRDPSRTATLLGGVIVNAIAAAAITFLKALTPPSRSQGMLAWLTGYLDTPSLPALGIVALFVVVGTAALAFDAGRMNVLALGDEAALHLGVSARAVERRVFFASSVVVGAIVSATGLIGFIGLVVPHALRKLVGPDARVLLFVSFLAGGATLVLCDAAARLLFRSLGTTPPVGAVTALAFGPAFLLILGRRGISSGR